MPPAVLRCADVREGQHIGRERGEGASPTVHILQVQMQQQQQWLLFLILGASGLKPGRGSPGSSTDWGEETRVHSVFQCAG